MNLFVLSPYKADSTSFYRSYGVLGKLSKHFPGLNLVPFQGQSFSWAEFNSIDVAFLQRPYSPLHLSVANYLKDMNIPIWVDYDDNLFMVPPDNNAYHNYQNKAIRKNIATLLQMADVVTVSTEALKKSFANLADNITVIPNALNDYLFNTNEIDYSQQNDTIIWRGSNTHVMDLMSYSRPIASVVEKYQKYEWMFLGYNPFFISGMLDKGKIRSADAVDPMLYHKNIKAIAPKLMHVPLVQTGFNLCKSNIAMIEGIWAGACCLVPDWEEWQIPGVFKYKDAKGYEKLLAELCSGNIDISKYHKQSWDYVRDNLLLSNINLMRKELIEGLVK